VEKNDDREADGKIDEKMGAFLRGESSDVNGSANGTERA
jgi:hypothetical protein